MTHQAPSLSSSRHALRERASRHLGLIVPAAVIGAVLVVVAPLPPVLMDLLLAANITLSVVILLTTTQVSHPLQFRVFPSLLLGATLGRLVLNIATTRLILTRAADHGTAAAGGVIATFGDFVASGSATVGLTLFLILIAVQFLVITRGATRISEVAARFALDGLPGHQLAIDADLAAGAISRDEAQARRRQLTEQADFYGAMDGASKFVRGDAVAGVVITAVNIVGGLAIGVFEHGMGLREAAGVFTTLTIGDGLVSQLPAFLIAVAAGLLVTRTSTDSNLADDAIRQTFAYPQALYAASVLLGILACTGLPMLPLLSLALGCALIGRSLEREEPPALEQLAEQRPPSATHPPLPANGPLFTPGETEPLALELGLGLLSLARRHDADGLVSQLAILRQRLARELGFVVPKLRIRDNLLLGFREFTISIDGVGVETGAAANAEQGVAAVLELVEKAIRRHAHELLSRDHVHQLLDHLRSMSPRLVDDVVPEPLKVGQVHQVLTLLLREQVSIRNLEAILTALADAAHQTRDVGELTEAVRRALARSLVRRYTRPDGTLPTITLDPLFEASLADGRVRAVEEALVTSLQSVLNAQAHGTCPVLVCRADLRPLLRSTLEDRLPQLTILSRHEVPPGVRLHVVSEVGQSLLRSEQAMIAA